MKPKPNRKLADSRLQDAKINEINFYQNIKTMQKERGINYVIYHETRKNRLER